MKFSIFIKSSLVLIISFGLAQYSYSQTTPENGSQVKAEKRLVHGEAVQGSVGGNAPEGAGDGIPNEVNGANSGQGHGDAREGAGDGIPNQVSGPDPFPGNGSPREGYGDGIPNQVGGNEPGQGNGNPPEGAGDGIPNNFGGNPDFYMDEDGDGINDLRADDDGDGIPNGKDPDFVAKQDGQGSMHRIRVRNGSNCPETGAGINSGGVGSSMGSKKKDAKQ